MADGADYAADRGWTRDDTGVNMIAPRILIAVATRPAFHRSMVKDSLIAQLCETTRSGKGKDIVAEMLLIGFAPEMIAEHLIPVAARKLGTDWFENRLNIVDLTIGTAWLPAMLRGLGCVWADDVSARRTAATVLMIVEAAEHHTLGAMVATGLLRHAGASVRLCVRQTLPQVHDLIETSDFDTIMVSGGGADGLETLRRLIINVRKAAPRSIPTVVWGAILGVAGEIKAITGADLVTNDPTEALGLCGLNSCKQGATQRASQGKRMTDRPQSPRIER